MKTQEQILNQIVEWKDDDFMGFKRSDLIQALTFENSLPYRKEDVTPEEWSLGQYLTDEQIKKVMQDYMPFAWEKANSCRGISAARSMSHYTAWMWLIGDEDKLGDLENYSFYGKDNLVKICNLYGWDSSQWDDNRRVNSESND